MSTLTHVVLIRGINVGGKNPVPMARLREALSARGFDEVRTYIQSGNVVLGAHGRPESDVTATVETTLREVFDVDTVVVTVTADALRVAVSQAPPGFGEEPGEYLDDVVFLRPHVDPADVHPLIRLRDGVDQSWVGPGVLYFRRLEARRSSSYLSKVVSLPFYKDVTIRNWRTTTTLVRMLDNPS